MKIVRGREGKPSEQRTDTFTGEVWGDVVLVDEGITVNSVFFAPGARQRVVFRGSLCLIMV